MFLSDFHAFCIFTSFFLYSFGLRCSLSIGLFSRGFWGYSHIFSRNSQEFDIFPWKQASLVDAMADVAFSFVVHKSRAVDEAIRLFPIELFTQHEF